MPQDANHDIASHTTVELSSEQWKLSLQPSIGLQTLVCQIKHQQHWVDLMPNCSSDEHKRGTPLGAGNFHMLPYSNRIRDGRFAHDGTTIQLDNGNNHSIHGALRKRAWRVTAQTDNSVTAEYDTQNDGEVNWPWAMHAVISYKLSNNELISHMRLRNNGSTSMPAGMGWHPYFCRSIAGAEPELAVTAQGVYPDTDGDCLPTGPAIEIPDALDFKTQRQLDPNHSIDHCFAGFVSPAILAWPKAGIQLNMYASDNCQHVIVYNPDEPYFAVEPVSNANDAFNLELKGVDAGVQLLAPGESFEATMRLEMV